jgi:antitoxin CcdA
MKNFAFFVGKGRVLPAYRNQEVCMQLTYDVAAPREAANVRINGSLLAKGRMLNIDLAVIFEQALAEVVRQRERELWLLENKDAIAAYVEFVDENGVFSDGMRSF